jgi:uncharacterized protein YqjF (DUF2071 family)
MDEYPIEPPERLRRASLTQQWQRLTFVHWRYEPAAVQAILPDGLTVDTFDGSAWVGLVPFHMIDVRPPFIPTLHPLTTFPETNIRTYVRGSRGQGVWFCSLEITRLLGVAVARALFGVPYTWAEMTIDQTSERIRYSSRRRWPEPRGASSLLEVEIGKRIEALGELDRFLTSRWATYSTLPGGRLGWVPVDHEPWPLHTAEIRELSESLTEAAGLPLPTSEAIAHYAPGVTARIGFPHRA